MIVWGEAQPLLAAPDGRVYAAAARMGHGRVVVVGHGGFLETTDADSEVFAANAVPWLADDLPASSKRHEPLRVFGITDAIATELGARGVTFERVQGGPAKLDFSGVDVIIGSPQAFAKASRLAELEAWITSGGGMLIAETAWGVLQLNKDLTLDTLAANQLLEPAGIRFDDEANSPFGENKDYPVDPSLLPLANADAALAHLASSANQRKPTGAQQDQLEHAARVVGLALANVPLKSPFIEHAQSLAAAHRTELDETYRTLAAKRLTPKSNPLARALIDLDSRLAMELPARELKAHASSIAFPGPLGPARDTDVAIEIDASVPGWHSTGLYAPPGELITISIPQELVNVGAVVQIGAWRDPHQHAYRVRLKNALRRFAIDAPSLEVASAIGGPVYIDLPREFAASHHPQVTIHISGAARAPHYVLGVTTLDEWRTTIRHLDAPWAEMESKNIILTVPAVAIRDVDRPDLVMQHWDRVHEAMQSLEPRTGNHWADRPYRYVADASVSWGYMYCPANGPLTIPDSAAADMFKVENFDAIGENKLWGHYHEMGHSHQNPLWTDGATGEVTVNIFTVYALHTVNGYALDDEATRTTPKIAWDTFEKQRASGKSFDDAGGPFDTLQFYALLWHAFGFEPFRTTFEQIRNLPEADRLKGDAAERDRFVLTFSRVVAKDLSAYAEAWGIAISPETKEAIKDLPAWLPKAP
jgi:hypothetical protein